MTGVGLCLPQVGDHVTPEVIVGFCREAERLGYTSLWVQDHFLWPLRPERGYAGRQGLPIPRQYQSVLAATELLTAAAMVTTRPQLGTSVLPARPRSGQGSVVSADTNIDPVDAAFIACSSC